MPAECPLSVGRFLSHVLFIFRRQVFFASSIWENLASIQKSAMCSQHFHKHPSSSSAHNIPQPTKLTSQLSTSVKPKHADLSSSTYSSRSWQRCCCPPLFEERAHRRHAQPFSRSKDHGKRSQNFQDTHPKHQGKSHHGSSRAYA